MKRRGFFVNRLHGKQSMEKWPRVSMQAGRTMAPNTNYQRSTTFRPRSQTNRLPIFPIKRLERIEAVGDVCSVFVLDKIKEICCKVHTLSNKISQSSWKKKADLEEHSYDEFITVKEMNIAEKEILKCLQKESFRDEVGTLSKDGNKFVKKSSSL